MSIPTKRTDAQEHRVHYVGDEGECDYMAVESDFARTLERELVQAQAERDETEKPFVDDTGQTWVRPTAWAYMRAIQDLNNATARAESSASRLAAVEKELNDGRNGLAQCMLEATTKIRRAERAMRQASFCLRELLPNDADAQMTVRMLESALSFCQSKDDAAIAQQPQQQPSVEPPVPPSSQPGTREEVSEDEIDEARAERDGWDDRTR